MKKKILFISLLLIVLMPICVNAITVVDCGNITDIPKKFPDLVSMIVRIIQIVVPIILVIFGMLDLLKGITSQKEDEIKKGQQILVKRLILAAVIFFVFVIVKLLISIVADSTTESGNIIDCMECFVNGTCKNEKTK